MWFRRVPALSAEVLNVLILTLNDDLPAGIYSSSMCSVSILSLGNVAKINSNRTTLEFLAETLV